MANPYFVQYLLNAEVFSTEEMRELLPKLKDVKISLKLKAFVSEKIDIQQLISISATDDNSFAEAFREKKLLTDEQIKELLADEFSKEICLVQLLLDTNRLDYETLNKYWKLWASEEEDILSKVVSKYSSLDKLESQSYASYADMFIRSMKKFIQTETLMSPKSLDDESDYGILISQGMAGEVSLVVGIMAEESALLELARRYSGYDLREIDDLAIDSVEEFLNVLNGLYIVELSRDGIELDLTEPRIAEDVIPEASNLAKYEVITEFGSFYLYMATDEFIF